MAVENADDLDALLIRNLRDLETATHRYYHYTEPRILGKIDEAINSWCQGKKWIGKSDWKGTGDVILYPADWQQGDECLATFNLEAAANDTWEELPTEDKLGLTRLCGTGKGHVGFRWRYGNALGIRKQGWKNFVLQNESFAQALSKSGFKNEDSVSFFMPFVVDADKLAAALVEDAFKEALAPISAALERIYDAKPKFDKMLDAAKKSFR